MQDVFEMKYAHAPIVPPPGTVTKHDSPSKSHVRKTPVPAARVVVDDEDSDDDDDDSDDDDDGNTSEEEREKQLKELRDQVCIRFCTFLYNINFRIVWENRLQWTKQGSRTGCLAEFILLKLGLVWPSSD